jgi:hypothetical protein
MAKFYGKIGYIDTVESEPGYWDEKAIEREYYGDITRNTSRYQNSGQVNDNIVINNILSIVADPYANENFQHMRYVEWMGAKWKITDVEVQYPRLILTLGGMYNGKEEEE